MVGSKFHFIYGCLVAILLILGVRSAFFLDKASLRFGNGSEYSVFSTGAQFGIGIITSQRPGSFRGGKLSTRTIPHQFSVHWWFKKYDRNESRYSAMGSLKSLAQRREWRIPYWIPISLMLVFWLVAHLKRVAARVKFDLATGGS